MERKVRTGRLKKGMYVSNLDRPWLDTPFLLQGFFINDKEDLKALDKYCDYVYIDTDRGPGADIYWDDGISLPTNEYLERFLRNKKREVEYVDEQEVSVEIPVAHAALEESLDIFKALLVVIKQGKKLDIKQLRKLLEPLIESVLRNPDALLWLSQLREKDDFAHSQAIDHTIIAVAFARHMGLPIEDVFHLAVGILLFDIGILNTREELLLKKTRLTEDEFLEMQKHVDDGVDYLRLFDGIHEDSINTVLTHHERFDGSGYPNMLSGMQIPVFGRIAGIVDCYQAMTSRRSYSEAISAHTALQKIYNWRNLYFQDELVEQFLKCMGVYPTGSLIEMKSGEVGIVLSQSRKRHIKPTVMLLLDSDKQAFRDFKVIDLMKSAEDSGGESFAILRGLDPGAYGIEPSDFYM